MMDGNLIFAGKIGQALGRTRQAIDNRARREKWSYKMVTGSGRGGQRRAYSIESLPPDVQAKVFQARECEATPDLDLNRAGASLSAWDRASEPNRNKALAWQEVIRACDEQTRGRNIVDSQRDFVLQYNNRNIFLPISGRIYEFLPKISLSNLRKNISKYKIFGLPGLLDSPNRGKPKKKLMPEMRDFITGLIAQAPHRRASRVHDYGKAKFGDLWPSARTVRRFVKWLKKEKKDLLLFLRNPDKWRSKSQAAFGDASAKAKHFLHIVEFDCTKGEIDFNGKRYNFTFSLDIFSRKLKALLSPTGSSMALCILLRQVILDWGIPDVALVDNGAEFVSDHFKAVCEALGIHIVHTQKYTPEGKGFVERGIWTVEMQFFEETSQYLGHNVAQRKDIEARRSFSQRMLKKGEVIECALSPSEFQEIMNAWIESIYHQRVHRGIDISPEAKAATSPRPVRKIQDPHLLDILLAPRGERIIRKKGIEFEAGQYAALELAERIGERIKIRQDLSDIGRLYVFDLNDEFVCVARDTSIEGITLKEAREAKKLQKKRIREEARALRTLSDSVGDPMITLIEKKRNAPGQVCALHREETFENKAIREAEKALRKRAEEEIEDKEQAVAAGGVANFGARLLAACSQRQKEPEKRKYRLIKD
ncbi:MAG: DDE-type integrase/transposase/recombinase [Deltaproteobacteria bacterium]|nr:DDE-type integrase/transposase/recombinase [Deltaproteobacteria bacterium]